MTVFGKIVVVAAVAGLVAGALETVAHHFGTAAIIAKAEVFEKAADQSQAGSAPSAGAGSSMAGMPMVGMSHDDATWEPKEGFQRSALTALSDILKDIGFAFLLVAAYTLSGREVDWRKGLYWGLAGFAAFTLAPGLGLPPEVPGTAAAPLLDRQVWWIATASATAAGLAMVFLTRRAIWALAGVGLLVLPHIFGAPQPIEYRSAAPEFLAHQFVVVAVVTSLLFWVLLGALTGLLYKRFQA